MRSLDELRGEFYEEIGDDLASMVDDPEVDRWLNQGQRRLGFYADTDTILTWTAGDRELDFPDDFRSFIRLTPEAGSTLPAHRLLDRRLRFICATGAEESGSATLIYNANPPKITGTQDSTLSEDGDDALVAYTLWRFFRKLATNRSFYKQYSVLVGQNAVGVDDLIAIGNQHLDEFLSVQDSEPVTPPASFFGG